MSVSSGKSAKSAKKQGSNPSKPATASTSFLKEAWKILKPNSRKQNPSEDDVLEALGVVVDDVKKGVEAGKKQSELLKEAEKKVKEAEKKAEEAEKRAKAAEKKAEEAEKAKNHGDGSDGKPVLNLAEMTEAQKKRVSANGQKLKEVEDDTEKLREEIKYTRAACSFHI